jgi:hypothetical protein
MGSSQLEDKKEATPNGVASFLSLIPTLDAGFQPVWDKRHCFKNHIFRSQVSTSPI